MFDSLIDNLDKDQWEEVSGKTEEWKKYQINRHHKSVDCNTIAFMVAELDGNPARVVLKFCRKNKDPLNGIQNIELKLNTDNTEIIGMDLNGDCVVRKGAI